MPKYKAGQYIKILGSCKPDMLNKTVLILCVYNDCYMILLPNGFSRPWTIEKADNNSIPDITMQILYGKKEWKHV